MDVYPEKWMVHRIMRVHGSYSKYKNAREGKCNESIIDTHVEWVILIKTCNITTNDSNDANRKVVLLDFS